MPNNKLDKPKKLSKLDILAKMGEISPNLVTLEETSDTYKTVRERTKERRF